MADFNFYLNRQGVRGRQGEKGDKGDQGYSPYIDIKSDTPTEFIMTVYNEAESFDTPNLIPQAIGEKVIELDTTVTRHTNEINTLNNEYNAVTDRLDAHTDDLMQIIQKNNEQDENLETLNTDNTIQKLDISNLYAADQRINNSILEINSKKQNKLVPGDNITLTNNSDGTTTISSTGGGGTIPDNVAVTDTSNTFHYSQTILNEHFGTTGLSIGQDDTEYPNHIDINKPNINITGNSINFRGKEESYTPTINVSYSDLPLNISAKELTINNVKIPSINDIKAGDNISIDRNATDGTLTISSTGGGEIPTNVVTTDTNQAITGQKVFNNDIVINHQNTVVSPTRENHIDLSNANGDTFISAEGVNKAFGLYTTSPSGIQINPYYNFNENQNDYGLSVKPNTLTYKGSDGTVTDLLAGGAIEETPIATTEVAGKVKPDGSTITVDSDGTIHSTILTNVVTTNTTQIITGQKVFKGSDINVQTNDDGTQGGGIAFIKPDEIGSITPYGTIRVGENRDLEIVADNNKNVLISGNGDGTVILCGNNPPIYRDTSLSSDIKDNILLSQDKLIEGDNITLTKDIVTGKVTISAAGGGELPDNVALTDKSNTFAETQKIETTGSTGLRISNQKFLQSNENYVMLTGHNGAPILSISATQGNTDIVTDVHIGAGNSSATTLSLSAYSGSLKLGNNTLTFAKSDGTEIDLLANSGGSAPENMVTTDTTQTISGSKSFTSPVIIGTNSTTAIANESGAMKFTASGNTGIMRLGSIGSGSNKVMGLAVDSSGLVTNTGSNVGLALGYYNNYAMVVGTKGEISLMPDSSNPTNNLKFGTNTLVYTKTDGTTIDLLQSSESPSSTEEKYGMEGDYATHYGIIDNPNGIIEYNATNKDIVVQQGLVLKCAGNGTAKSTIATAIPHTVTSTGAFTLFYANGNLLECGKVDYSVKEPEDNGVDNYQAWFNPDKTANPNQQWQFKSNDTGNVFRSVDSATPLADIIASSTGITSVSYIGYRVIDDDIFAQQSDVESIQNDVEDLTNTVNNAVLTSGDQEITGSKRFKGTLGVGNYGNISTSGLDGFTFSNSVGQGYSAIKTGDIITDAYGRKVTFSNNTSHIAGYVGFGDSSGSYGFGIGRSEDGATDSDSYPVTVRGHLKNYDGGNYLKDTDTTFIAHQAMPSNRYINLTLGASGTTYTAPADGYVKLGGQGKSVRLESTSGSTGAGYFSDSAGNQFPMISILVSAGQSFTLRYSEFNPLTWGYFRFYYAEGAPSA